MSRRELKKELSYVTHLEKGQKKKIEDMTHKSKAFVPIRADEESCAEIIQADGGL